MITSEGLKQLGFVPNNDYVLQDDGSGTYIREWLSNDPQPTEAEIETAHTQWQAVRTVKANNLASAKIKLEALGLTVDEIKEAFGI